MKYLFSICFLIFSLNNLSYGQLSLFYPPEEDSISFLSNKEIVRDQDFIRIAKKDDEISSQFYCSQDSMDILVNSLSTIFKNKYIDELYSKSHEFIDQHLNPDDKIIFLGRSPTIVKYIFEGLLPDASKDQLVSIFFSGNPDAFKVKNLLPVPSHFFSHPDFSNRIDFLKNLVTPSNLNAFYSYLNQKKLNEVKGKLFIMDVVSTGTSINSFLRMISNYYRFYLKVELPDIYLVSINLPVQQKNASPMAFSIESTYHLNRLKNNILKFSKFEDFGLKKMSIDTVFLGLNNEISVLLDDPYLQLALLNDFSFAAYRWTNENVKKIIRLEENLLESSLFLQMIKQFIEESSRLNLKPSVIYNLSVQYLSEDNKVK